MKPLNRRISRLDALHHWHNVIIAMIRDDGPVLSPRQMAIMLAVYLHDEPHTVRSLAAHLKVTKAVITRALDTLGRQKLIQRCADPKDRRSITVARTPLGSRFLSGFADNIITNLPQSGLEIVDLVTVSDTEPSHRSQVQ